MTTRFRIGEVLATGFRVWARNFFPFLLISALSYAPLWIWGLSCAQDAADRENIHSFIVFETYSPMLSWVLYLLNSAALTYGVVMELQGQRASLIACLSRWIRRLWPALTSLVVLTLGFCILSVVLVGLTEVVGGKAAAGLWLVLLLWISSIVYVATQAAVFERPGAFGAIGRSRALTRGHRIRIAILVVLLIVLTSGLGAVLRSATLPDFSLFLYLDLARSVLVGSLASVMAGVAYYFLRAEKEGTSASELAAVFD
jgi:hypothetical protein